MKIEMLQAKLYDFKAIDIEKESEDKYKDNKIYRYNTKNGKRFIKESSS